MGGEEHETGGGKVNRKASNSETPKLKYDTEKINLYPIYILE